MAQSSEKDEPRNDPSDLFHELADLVGEPETARTDANPDAQLAVIRGEGLPKILHDGVEASQHTWSHRRRSDTSATSRISNHTVTDRGESKYRAAHPLESAQPTNGESAMPANQSPDPLVNRLLRLKVRPSQSNGAFFYPRGEVEALITAEEVARVIKQGRRFLEEANKVLTDREIHEYASRVCRDTLPDGTYVSYKRAFAILLLIRRGSDIVLFVDEHIHDAELPLKDVKVGVNERRMRRQSDPETDLPCLRHWDALAHEDFEERQWGMLAPFLDKGGRGAAWFYKLCDKDVLPWTSKESCVAEGSYGTISKVKIHPCHHNFDGGNGFFAVKEFKPDKSARPGTDLSEDFKREIEILMRFSGNVDPHLISLQLAYRQGDTYCVILPWADCDLKSLWKTSSLGDPLHKANLLWLLDQSVGLAGGLRRIHYYVTTEPATHEKADASPDKRIFGRHGDIKPGNILLFRGHQNHQDLGRLVLADFGLSRFHSEHTRTYFTYKQILTTITYRPPECDMEGRNVSRSFDMWSLGCVLLEFVAWYLGGPELLNYFVLRRKVQDPLLSGWPVDDFFEIVRPEIGSSGAVYARVKCEVLDFVNNELHAHPKCSEPVHELLKLIMEKLLVVESKGILKRADSCEVHTALLEIRQTASKLQTLTATPRSKVESVLEAVEMPLNVQKREIAQSRYRELRTHSGRTRTLPANGLQYR